MALLCSRRSATDCMTELDLKAQIMQGCLLKKEAVPHLPTRKINNVVIKA
jgi:hypothetical protein